MLLKTYSLTYQIQLKRININVKCSEKVDKTSDCTWCPPAFGNLMIAYSAHFES